MTETVNSLYTMVAGQSSVPTAAGVMGPLQGSAGALGGGGKIDFMKVLAGGSSFASAAASVFAGDKQADFIRSQGRADAEQLELMSKQSMLDSKQAELQGQQAGNQILDNLVQTLATQRLAFSGNGFDPTFGTPGSVAKSTQNLADRQLSVTRSDARQLALSRRAQSYAYLSKRSATLSAAKQGASEASNKGMVAGQGVLADAELRRLQRG